MNIKDFVTKAIIELNPELFNSLKEKTVKKYIQIEFIDSENMGQVQFAEKIYDYFEKVLLKQGCSFNKIISRYIDTWNEIVEKYIPKVAPAKKGAEPQPATRSRKYFDHAMKILETSKKSFEQMVDFTRIMMCLYMPVISNNDKKVDDFNLSSSCLDIDGIVEKMLTEKSNGIFGKNLVIIASDKFSADEAIMMITIIAYYCIKNNEKSGV